MLVGVLTTLLGLVFALVVTRTGFRYGKLLRALTVLPIITPPFVIGLAIILLFGLSGAVTQGFAELFGIQPTRWVYGLPGLLIAQVLAFTPIAFLVLIGVVEGVSPSMEEAAQTLRANRWQTFWTVSLPLMRPGLANAFLLGFIESMADFGNPLVLGGNFDVLSTEIFFAIVGAQNDQAQAAILAHRAAVLHARRLLCAALLARQEVLHHRLRQGRRRRASAAAARACATSSTRSPASGRCSRCSIYATIFYGSFVKLWGVDFTPDLRPLRESLRRRLERIRHPLDGRGLEFVLDDDADRADLGAADRGDRAADRLSAGAPGFPPARTPSSSAPCCPSPFRAR